MRPLTHLLVGLVLLAAPAAAQRDSATLVIRLGTDTTTILRYRIEPGRFSVDEVTISPRVLRRYAQGTLRADGSIASYEARTVDPEAAAGAAPIDYTRIITRGDTTVMKLGLTGRDSLVVPGFGHFFNNAVTFYGFYPAIVAHAPTTVGDSIVTQQLGRLGTRRFVIRRTAPDQIVMGSNLMGMVRIKTDAQRRLLGMDGFASSVNTTATRLPWLDIDSVTEVQLAKQKARGPAGSISPRDTAHARLNNGVLFIDYGRPSKRGREIFGGIVPWGRVWRTGANTATHLFTDRTLVFGDVMVPAGRYTLWTLPTQQGWTLIISKQVGQWGTDYDPAHDLVRVPMRTRTLAEPVEQFTIELHAGTLRLLWDRTEAVVDFTVR